MKKIIVSILMASSILGANAQVFQTNGNQNVVGKLLVYPTGTTSDNAYNGNIVITKPVTSGQYLNFIRQGSTRWSLGTVYNSNTFAIGQGTTSDAGFTAPIFNITPGGNIGIGTTTPGNRLDVRGVNSITSGGHEMAAFANLSGTAGVINGWYANGSVVTGGWTRSINNLPYYLGTTTMPQALTILDNGSIGIGTTTPSSMLQVEASSGNGLRIGKIGDAGTLTVPLNSVAASYNLDFSGYRNIVLDQIGARIAALRFNNCQANNALVQNTGLSFYTNPTGDYPGTTGLVEQMRIMPNGFIGIGCLDPQFKLDVKGTIRAAEIRVVSINSFPDYVFKPNYVLTKLKEVDSYIQKEGHLPNMPNAKDVKDNGVSLVDMQMKLLQKVEELTLYAIEQQKRIEQLENALKEKRW